MQRKRIRATTLLAIGILIAALQPVGASSERSLWVWDGPTDSVIEFAVTHGITDIYLHAPPNFSRNGLYSQFIESAHAVGINVLAAGGNPSWSSDSGAWNAWVDEVVAFQGFDGLVFDVEPHLHPDWDTRKQHRLLRLFVNGLQRAALRAGSLPVYTTVPFWWDLPAYRVRSNLLVEHVLDHSDGIVIMAYRDTVEGDDGIIQLARNEANLAALKGREFVIGVETSPTESDKISFAEEGSANLEIELAKVRARYETMATFAGTAVHDFESYSSLGP